MRGALRRRGAAALAVAAVLAFAGAVLPELALTPFDAVVARMRSPQDAVVVARSVFIALLALSLLALAGRQRLAIWAGSGVAWLSSLPPARFWLISLGAACAVRLATALGVPYEPTSDALWYHDAAVSLASGQGFAVDGVPTAYRGPAYPFLLSLAYRLLGPHVGLAWFWGALASLVIIGSVFFAARRMYGEDVARLAAAAASVYPGLVLYTGQSMSDLVFAAGVWFGLALILNARPFAPAIAVAVGSMAGLLALCRGTGAGLFLLLPMLWLLRSWEPRRCVLAILLSAMGFILTVGPWMARNSAVMGTWSLGTNLGVNLYIGNHAGASGTYEQPHPLASVTPAHGERDLDRAYLQEAVAFVKNDPMGALALVPRKLLHLYALETNAVTQLFQGNSHGPDRLKNLLHVTSQLAYVLVGLAVLVRLSAGKKPEGPQWSGWLLAAYFTLFALVFHASDRYRLPILPLLLIEGAGGLLLLVQPRKRSINPFSSSSDEN